MSKPPKKTKDWAKEIAFALKEAWPVLEEAEKDLGKELKKRLFISAPVLAMKQRNIDFKKEEAAITYACESVVELCREHPEFEDKPNRCFAHAYLDTHIYFKLLKKSKCQDIIYYLEAKDIIEG